MAIAAEGGSLMARSVVVPPESERQFQGVVVGLAKAFGWACYWTWNSLHSPAGWPDLILLRPPRAVAAELKTEKGKVGAAQTVTLALLRACGFETYLWRPSDKQRIAEVLR